MMRMLLIASLTPQKFQINLMPMRRQVGNVDDAFGAVLYAKGPPLRMTARSRLSRKGTRAIDCLAKAYS